jgi:hypothetical protein
VGPRWVCSEERDSTDQTGPDGEDLMRLARLAAPATLTIALFTAPPGAEAQPAEKTSGSRSGPTPCEVLYDRRDS